MKILFQQTAKDSLCVLVTKVIMRTYSKKSISALIVVLLIAAGQALWTQSGGEIRGERVIVSKIYDGDTIVVGRGWRRTTIRLIGVDTPETVHPDNPSPIYD